MFCFNCGKFFPEADIVQRRDGETALHLYCCPWCGVDDIGESAECQVCGNEFPEDELYNGICHECEARLEYEEGEECEEVEE